MGSYGKPNKKIRGSGDADAIITLSS